MPTGTEGELAICVLSVVCGKQAVVDFALVDHVEAEQPFNLKRRMGAGDAGFQPFDAAAVVNGIEEAGDQVLRLAHGERAHVLHRKVRLRAADGGLVEDRLINIQAAADVAGFNKMLHMRPRSAGQVEVAAAGIAEQLLQPMNAVALRLVVDIGAHQIVIIGQVGVEGIYGHSDLMMGEPLWRARIIAQAWASPYSSGPRAPPRSHAHANTPGRGRYNAALADRLEPD